MPRGRPKKIRSEEEQVAAKKKEASSKRAKADVERKQQADTTAARAANMKYKTPEELQAKCDEYFAERDAVGGLYGEAGLALKLGVSLHTLHSWYDGRYATELRPVVEEAYLKIQDQVETSDVYQDKALSARAIFLMKQMRLGGKVDKVESKQDIAVKVKMGKGMDEQDFG